MKLIIGLGNPGKKYEKTRHNIGFMALDRLVKKLGLNFHSGKFSAEQAIKTDELHDKIFFLKPQTYMNKSGDSVAALAQFYKIDPDDMLVIHDDLDLPLGRLRVVRKGSAGGHNGIKSIIEKLGAQNFNRLKLGIGRPADARVDVVDYVLMPFASSERQALESTLETAVQALDVFLQKGPQDAMNEFNGIKLK